MKNIQILIIEDDRDIRESVRILLEGENFYVEEAKDGFEGIEKLSEEIDLVILDIMMPGISGIKTCQKIREFSYVPILFLTAKSDESDKVLALMAGGDDYLVKPFSYAELSARVKAILRRHHVYMQREKPSEEQWLQHHNLKINTQVNRVYLGEEEILLTDTEYEILMLLMKYPSKIFSVENIYESVWEEPFYANSSNTVMVHIRKLRIKIEQNPQKPDYIKTVWGKGYRFGQVSV